MFQFFLKDVGIDLGTQSTRIYLKGRGILLTEPTIVAINIKTNKILATGYDAKKMQSRTPPHIHVIEPLESGVISDFEMTQEFLRQILRRANKQVFLNYRSAIVGVPSNLTEVERKSVEDAAMGAGARKAYLVEETVAATIGAGLPIHEPTSSMVIDIGHGTTDIAIISLGGAVVSKSLKIAGARFCTDIIQFVREEFKLIIGEPTAEEVKIAVGSALPIDEKLEYTIRGRDAASGLPREIVVKNTQIRMALLRSLRQILDGIKEVIETAPPELSGDIYKHGVFLSGGSSLLRGIEQLISRELTIKARVIDDPMTATIRGIGMILEQFAYYQKFLENPYRPKEIQL